MKRFLLLLALAAGIVARAQDEPEPPGWFNVSKLAFVANKGTDPAKAPIQYMLFADKTVKENEDLFNQYLALMEEISQEDKNQVIPETLKVQE